MKPSPAPEFRACRRDQSSPSMSAASCEVDSRMTPSLIGGQRNAPSSRRFQYKIRPEPSQAKIFNRSARSNGRRRSSQKTDRVEALLRQRRQAVGATPEVDRLRRHRTRTPERTEITSRPSPTAAPSSASPDRFQDQRAPPPRRARSRSSRMELRRRLPKMAPHASTITGAKVTLPAAAPWRWTARRCASHRQRTVAAAGTISPGDSRDFVLATIALRENRRLLLRRPSAPAARSGENLKPSNRLTLRLVQKPSVRHVSNSLSNSATSDNRPLANALEGAIKGPLTKLQPIAALIHSAAGINFKLTPEPVELSKREEECLIWAARGKTFHDIAALLNLSFASVKTYLDTARHKLSCINLTHAVAVAIATGVIPAKALRWPD